MINGQPNSSPALYCSGTPYSANSTYSANLNALLSSLSSNSSRPNGFYNTTVGNNGSDIIYGLLLCRGDVSSAQCQNCVSTAVRNVTSEGYCPNGKESILWFDKCLIRYSNQSLFGSETGLAFTNREIISESQRFRSVLGDAMNELLATVAANGNNRSGKIFATKEANYSSVDRVYTFAQCIPDLSNSSCENCLRNAVGSLPTEAVRGSRVLLPSCNVRYETYPFYNVTSAPPPASSSPPPSPPGEGGIASGVIAAIVVSIVVSILLFIFGFCWLRSRASREFNVVEDMTDAGEISTAESLQYHFNTIRDATTNFSTDNRIGEGGFGVVYKGKLPDGQEIAVKRLSGSSGQGVEEFKNEILLIAQLQHRNLVRLLGYCFEGEEKILVYEFVPNKSLDYFLFCWFQSYNFHFSYSSCLCRNNLLQKYKVRLRTINTMLSGPPGFSLEEVKL